MLAVLSFLARNRAKIGAGLVAAVTFAMTTPVVQQHPYVMVVLGALSAYILAAGAHKSDSYQVRKQMEKGVIPERRSSE